MTYRWSIPLALAVLLVTVGGCETSEGSNSNPASAETASSSHATDQRTSKSEGHTDGKHGKTAHEAKGHGRHHDFEHPEKYAEEWNSEARDDWQKPEEVIELIGAEPGETVVDLGTGTGYFLPHLSRAVGPEGTVLAVDVSQKMLDFVDSKIRPELPHDNLEVRKVARTDPGLDAASVDHVLTVNTWHHIKDRVAYAKKLLEALEPGGTFVDVDYTMETNKGPPPKIRLTPDEVVEELEEAGFEARVAEESLPEQYVVIATKSTE